MPRPPADTVQITFRVPSHWLDEADALASTMAVHGMQATRTDAFREAMGRGFRLLEQDAKKESKYRISAWDGVRSTCLFWFGPDGRTALAEAKRLAQKHAGGKWTCFRVYEDDAADPFHVEPVANPELLKPTTTPKKKR